MQRNTYHTGVALQQVFENRSHAKLDFYQLARNLGSAVPESTKVVLNSNVFALMIGSLNSNALSETLRRIDIGETNFWDGIGRDRELQKFFGRTKTRETNEE